MRACLYRVFSQDGVLLYVGVSRNPKRRMQGHRCYSPWFHEADRYTENWFDDEGSAYLAEKLVIENEQPKHNLVIYKAWRTGKAA